jgi:ribonuclease BN (tRNA processing enzyme)
VHIWGPPSRSADLATRLNRYLSPPLFPVRLKELGSRVTLHDAPTDPTFVGGVEIAAELIIHPGPTVGYRLTEDGRSLAYLPDHEPALGVRRFPESPAWTSGSALAHRANILIHDAQYSVEERAARVGWGHSSLPEAVAFAELVGASALIPFHHDPAHDDDALDQLIGSVSHRPVDLKPAAEGVTFEV